MFPRSERFVEKIDITPGPNHYDVKLNDDDPYKRFGFLGKTQRFRDNAKNQSAESTNNSSINTAASPNGTGSPYERGSLNVSVPSLIIDDDASSVHSNGSTTPDYPSRRPSNVGRSKSSDKLSTASSKVEERLKRELAELTDKFEKYKISHQRDLEAMTDKHKKSETQYQGAIKEKCSILTQLATKESEIAELVARHTKLKASLEKSEKIASSVAEKSSKSALLQKRIDELERLLARSRLSLEEQESISKDFKQKLERERQESILQSNHLREMSEQELARVQALHQAAEARYQEDLMIAKEDSDHWRKKLEALEKRIRELEEQLEAERRLVAELRAMMEKERAHMLEKIDQTHVQLAEAQRQNREIETISQASIEQLKREKNFLDQSLQASRSAFDSLESTYKATEATLTEQSRQHADAVSNMSKQYQEQQEILSKERNENVKVVSNLEQSIAHLIMELGQNRDTLLEAQRDQSELQDKYDKRQHDLQELKRTLETLELKHKELDESGQQERESWSTKYRDLSSSSNQAQEESAAVLDDLRTELSDKEDELAQVMRTIGTVQAELHKVESEREEVVAQRQEELAKYEETLSRLKELQEQKEQQDRRQDALEQASTALTEERKRLLKETMAQEESITALKSQVEHERADKLRREVQAQKRIEELEEIYRVATKQAETFHDNEKVWESERMNLLETASNHEEIIHGLKSQLENMATERSKESTVNHIRIQDLEDRCRAMEQACKDMYAKAGSPPIGSETSVEDWRLYVSAVEKVLEQRSSIGKNEHAALLEEQSNLLQKCASLTTSLQDREATMSKAVADHAGLFAKIQELEDMIRVLKAQVELLEAENIGKVAIIKALQDEYDYQEKVIKDLIKNEDAAKEVIRLEEELRAMTDHTRKTDEWIQQVQADVEKYRAAYVKADLAREETLLDMAKLHEELAESEQTRLQVEHQLQTEVGILIKKYELSDEELSRLSKMNVDSAQNQGLKQKVKQVAQLKEEVMALKKKNLTLSNTRDSLRLKCLQVERELEAYKAASVSTATAIPTARSNRQSRASSVTSSSSSILSGFPSLNFINSASPETSPLPGTRLQLQAIVPVPPETVTTPTTATHSPSSRSPPKSSPRSFLQKEKPVLQSKAARTVLGNQSSTQQ
ncbi:hypothetical protein BGZ83_002467 [Gryganskiella cystojenkinii]|nr:hypothetical protein BGZ83_002467 [Gryganskiella cystojenkinii]